MNEFLNLPPLRKPRKVKPKPTLMPQWCKDRYNQAHEADFKAKYPQAYASGNYFTPVIPKIRTSNGLTLAIINYLLWCKHNADRTGTQGRMIKVKGEFKRITSANRKGTSDISATIFGRSVKLEIKIHPDKPSPEQLKEQIRERSAQGCYEFIYSIEDFFLWYDNFLRIYKNF